LHRARNTEDDVRTIAGPWEGRRGLEEKLAVKLPALELKAGGTSELSLKSSTQIRQVGRSAGRQVGRSAGRQVGSEYQPCPARSGATIGTGLPER
jgi:hypothetical protein